MTWYIYDLFPYHIYPFFFLLSFLSREQKLCRNFRHGNEPPLGNHVDFTGPMVTETRLIRQKSNSQEYEVHPVEKTFLSFFLSYLFARSTQLEFVSLLPLVVFYFVLHAGLSTGIPDFQSLTSHSDLGIGEGKSQVGQGLSIKSMSPYFVLSPPPNLYDVRIIGSANKI